MPTRGIYSDVTLPPLTPYAVGSAQALAALENEQSGFLFVIIGGCYIRVGCFKYGSSGLWQLREKRRVASFKQV
jgi:hypothetical protein